MQRLALLALPLLGGCLSSGTFTTARTLPPLELSHTAGLGLYLYPGFEDVKYPVPAVSYALRVGIADRLDLGVQATIPSGARIDFKYNPLRTRWLDASVAPAFSAVYFPTEGEAGDGKVALILDLPVIVAFNATGQFSVVLHGGPGYLYSPDAGGGGLVTRFGGGLRFRIGDTLALQPELTMVLDPYRRAVIDYSFGAGITFGARPDTIDDAP